MTDWFARYAEGYITIDGESVTITDELHCEYPWPSPAEAQAHWSKRKDLQSSGIAMLGNGFQQTDDVHNRPAFAALGVAMIWRRVTFETTVAECERN